MERRGGRRAEPLAEGQEATGVHRGSSLRGFDACRHRRHDSRSV